MEGGHSLKREKLSIKKIFLSKINRKLTILFLIVGLLAPSAGIFYFYNLTVSSLPDTIPYQQTNLMRTVALMIITLIAIDTGFIGYLVSRSI